MQNRPMPPAEYHAWYLQQVQNPNTPPQTPAPPKKQVKGKPKKRAVVKKSDVSLGAWLVILFIVFLGIMAVKSKYEKDTLQYQPPPPKTNIKYTKK